MKKIISITLVVIVILFCAIPTSALAANNTENDVYFTQEEFELLNPIHAEYKGNANTRATGLITDYDLAIAKSGTKLVISGYTYGSSDVVKCGFKEIVIQRRTNSSSSWSNYTTYQFLFLH